MLKNFFCEKIDEFFEGRYDTECKRNKVKLPVNHIEPKREEIERFNEVYSIVKDFKEIPSTPSGGVSTKGLTRGYYICFTGATNSGFEIIIICWNKWYRVQFKNSYNFEDGTKISGREAFNRFKKEVEKEGGNLEDLTIDNGKDVKVSIMQDTDNDFDHDTGLRKSFDIWINPKYKDKVIYNAIHIDINSAFMAGIKKAYGEELNGALGRAIQNIFNQRKDPNKKELFKAILNCTQGFMQSRYCILNGKAYALAHLSKAGIEFCYNELQKIKKIFENVNYEVVATNTDGVWIVEKNGGWWDKSELEKAPGCGEELGQFKIDHFGCKLRYRTAGCYEFIENGVYKAVIRGTTKLDYIIPREEWKWGYIYQEEVKVLKYAFSKKEGIIEYGSEIEDRCLQSL